VITRCWDVLPELRPDFVDLSPVIASFMEESICDYYMALNQPYLEMNTLVQQRKDEMESLAFSSPPYLCMQGKSVRFANQ